MKLCDFGISGYLVNSVAQTYEAGCKPYMAPERINPDKNRQGYDIRSGIFILSLTLSHNSYIVDHRLYKVTYDQTIFLFAVILKFEGL